MRRVIATLGALAIVGALTADLAAQARTRPGQPAPGGQTTRTGQARPKPDNGTGNCGDLGQLRHELARLHQELRRLHEALAEARKAGNRERMQQIMQEIRQVQAQIQDVQQKIRRLQQQCGGR
jgi:DNA repair exonuclease SbcCD ATPase subunit